MSFGGQVEEVFRRVKALEPDEKLDAVDSAIISEVADLMDHAYVKGAEMQRKLIRIRLGLATESDN